VETRKEEQKPARPVTEAKEKKRRFEIVKLEERIAPGNGHGNGSNNYCGTHHTCNIGCA
jgi:hypothetical protein